MNLLHPDPKLPGIKLLLSPSELSVQLRDWLGDAELTLESIRYKPATSCLVSYRVRLDGTQDYLHAKAFPKREWETRKQKFQDQAWIDDELAIAVFRFPIDQQLPSVEELVSSPACFLDRLLFARFEPSHFVGMKVLAYKPNRRLVVRVDRTDDSPIVVKLHDSRTFERAMQTASALKKFAIQGLPARVGRSASKQALAFEWIEGQPLALEAQQADEPAVVMHLLFEWLERLHQIEISRRTRLNIRLPREGIVEIAQDIGALCSTLMPKATEIADRIVRTHPGSYVPRLVHGDFHERQLLMDGDQIRGCDFDSCCLDDSTVDLANFAAHLFYQDTVCGSVSDRTTGIVELCRQAAAEEAGRGGDKRFHWNLSTSLFRLATHPFRSGASNWNETMELILTTVQACLNQSQATRISTHSHKSHESHATVLHQKILAQLMSDNKFDFLHDCLNEKQAEKRLRGCLSNYFKKTGQFVVNQVHPLRHKRGRRCLIEFELISQRGFQNILGKSSAKRLDMKSHDVQRELFESHGFDDQCIDAISVAQPLGYCPQWKMWFQSSLPAASASQLMAEGRLASISGRIAAAIHKLHRCGLTVDRRHTLKDEIQVLEERFEATCAEMPECADSIDLVLRRCHQIADCIDDQHPIALIHRDFYQDQILFAGERTYLVDFDLAAMGHPLLDVANFCAHLIEDGLRCHRDPCHWDAEQQSIAQRYLELNPECSRRDYLGMRAISFARHIAISRLIPDRQATTRAIIAEASKLTNDFFNTFVVDDETANLELGVK